MIDFKTIPTGRIPQVEENLESLEAEVLTGDPETADFVAEFTENYMSLFQEKVHTDALRVYEEQLNQLRRS